MGRLHLPEIEDEKWCPKFIRQATTDILRVFYDIFNTYELAYKKISEIIDITKSTQIVDCCSGSGGPIPHLRDYLNKNNKEFIPITLTDKYPNIACYEQLEALYPNQIVGHRSPIDATNFPKEMTGLRTIFSSFHHFKPDEAIKVLKNAIDNDAPIAIFETIHRSPADFLRAFLSPLFIPFIIPFSRNLNWRKIFFTYLIPIIPLTFAWDYIASIARTYSIKEMETLVAQLNAPHYEWEIGKEWSKQAKCYIYYLVGFPIKSSQNR